jgi:serine/threonine-protein kinase
LGVILGTAGYIAPEQARGRNVDQRADIWAFGVVVYEILTGKPLFAGATVSDTLAAVLKEEPDLSRVPAKVRRLVEPWLRKDANERLQAIADGRLLLEDAADRFPAAPRRSLVALAAVAGELAISLIVSGVYSLRATRPVERPLARLNVDLGPAALVGLSTTVAISPDGQRIVFPARGPDGKGQLATRLLEQSPLYNPDQRALRSKEKQCH